MGMQMVDITDKGGCRDEETGLWKGSEVHLNLY